MSDIKSEHTGINPDKERLKGGNLIRFGLPENFDYKNGEIYIFPIGNFNTLLIDPETGEIIEKNLLPDKIRQTHIIGIYAPEISVGQSVLVLTKTNNSKEHQLVSRLIEKTETGWQPKKSGLLEAVLMYSDKSVLSYG